MRPALRQAFVDLCRGSVGAYLDRFGFRSNMLQAMYAVRLAGMCCVRSRAVVLLPPGLQHCICHVVERRALLPAGHAPCTFASCALRPASAADH